jgi:hypothetical protein
LNESKINTQYVTPFVFVFISDFVALIMHLFLKFYFFVTSGSILW